MKTASSIRRCRNAAGKEKMEISGSLRRVDRRCAIQFAPSFSPTSRRMRSKSRLELRNAPAGRTKRPSVVQHDSCKQSEESRSTELPSSAVSFSSQDALFISCDHFDLSVTVRCHVEHFCYLSIVANENGVEGSMEIATIGAKLRDRAT